MNPFQDKIDALLIRAEECNLIAKLTGDPIVKERNTLLAEDFRRLAAEASVVGSASYTVPAADIPSVVNSQQPEPARE